ncbi:MAG TPA: radical SAM family heme chaperone HemW [Acidimicrobiia bacterium]|nr:radical SAM family heme chaperone HemW [Acidimicrobiia bacterium]
MVGFGVYVHVPFCERRCDYCDFATWTDRHHLMEAYAAACVTDLTRRYDRGPVPVATSVFFGGGTPSLLPAELLVGILAAVRRLPDAEVTVECNPDTVTPELLAAYRAGGVTRLSFGVQSMARHVLSALGRTHDPASVELAVAAARETGFDNFNLDLIYGGAGETLADWQGTLDTALALDPPHVSAYALTVEPGTPLARRIGAGEVTAPDDDDQAEKYLAADAALSAAGRPWYEISNWARPGLECRHNLLYWAQGEYLGIGCAAHGHTPAGRRWWNVRTPDRYIALIGQDAAPEGGHELVVGPDRDQEAAMLALRTRDGVPGGLVADSLVTDGLAEHRHGRVVLTPAGRLLANEATTRLLGASTSG